jgi:hypothetical protein
MDEGNDDARARVANCMTQGNSTAVDVHLGSWNIENLLGDIDDNGESLVDLKQGDIVNGQASLLQSLGDGESWSGGEINRVNASVGIGW